MNRTARRPAWAARPRVAARALLAGVVALLPPGVAAAEVPSPTAPRQVAHQAVGGLRVVLDDVAPAVPRIGEPVVLRGRVVNESSVQQRIGQVSVEASWTPLTTRADIAAWHAAPVGSGTEWLLGSDGAGPVVAVGASVPFTVSVPGQALEGLPGERAVLGLEIHAHDEEAGRPGLVVEAPATLRTVLAVDRGTDVPEPLRTSWLVPLTLPADPDLVAADDEAWRAAWVGATGEGSPAATWLDGFDGDGVTWVVDPALLGASRPEPLAAEGGGATGEPTDAPAETVTEEPTGDPGGTATEEPGTGAPRDDATATTGPDGGDAATPGPPGPATTTTAAADDAPATVGPPAGPSPTDEDTGSDATPPAQEPLAPEAEVSAALATLRERLAEVDEARRWWLPTHDPDLAAILAGTGDERLLEQLLERDPVSEETRELIDRGPPGLAWPLLRGATAADLSRLATAWAGAGEGSPTVVLPREAVTGTSGAPVAHGAVPLADPVGLTAVTPDSRASSLLAAAGDEAERHGAGATVQHLLADTLAAWGESPSATRSVVIAPPRGTELPAAVLAQLDDALDAAPWLTPVAVDTLVDEAGALPPTALTGAVPEPQVLGEPAAYLDAGASPLDAEGLRALATVRRQLRGLQQVLAGPTAVSTWERTLTGAWSTRWRGEPDAWQGWWAPVRAAEDDARAALHVNPGTVNFLAEEGLMRVTIVNALPVAVEDVQVRLVPSSNVLQVVDQPEPLSVGADSRATVTFSARAVTRGVTTVRAELTAPNGTTLGDEAAVSVRVQPTGVWIYWVLGGVAGVVLALGLARAVRSTPRAVLAGAQQPGADSSGTPSGAA